MRSWSSLVFLATLRATRPLPPRPPRRCSAEPQEQGNDRRVDLRARPGRDRDRLRHQDVPHESRIDAVAATGDTVEVVAFQWGWTFRHDGRTVTGDDLHDPTLVVKAGRTIRFRIISRDVIHSFWIPSERFKRDAFPQRWTEFDLTFDRPGSYVGRCAEFCGLQHAAWASR